MTREELERRIEEAARIRLLLRTTTREMREIGDRIMAERSGGPRRPDGDGAPRR